MFGSLISSLMNKLSLKYRRRKTKCKFIKK